MDLDGTSYRLFVEKGYYNTVPDLFQNEVNDIWLDFTNSIYGAQKKMTNLYMWISLGIMALTLIECICDDILPRRRTNHFLSYYGYFIHRIVCWF